MRRRHEMQTLYRREGGRLLRQRRARWFGKPGSKTDSVCKLSCSFPLFLSFLQSFLTGSMEVGVVVALMGESFYRRMIRLWKGNRLYLAFKRYLWTSLFKCQSGVGFA